MMTGDILYAVVNSRDERQGGYRNTFKLYDTLKGARTVAKGCLRYAPAEVFRIIKVHLEEVDQIETTESY